jgi:hypothetical protein
MKDSGYLVYNVANTQGCKTLVEAVTEQAYKRGFYLHKTLYLKLSSIMASGHKVEPVLIFKKL